MHSTREEEEEDVDRTSVGEGGEEEWVSDSTLVGGVGVDERPWQRVLWVSPWRPSFWSRLLSFWEREVSKVSEHMGTYFYTMRTPSRVKPEEQLLRTTITI